jgi:sugar O-acyltransferase (sialic acid O-acetyltransferase NeuD family)
MREGAIMQEGAIVGLGAGGHAAVMIDALKATGARIVGLLDPEPSRQGESVLGVPVLGDDSLLPGLLAQGVGQFFVGVGSVGDSGLRVRLYEHARRLGLTPVRCVHPAAIVSAYAVLAPGVAVLAGAVVNARARLGENVIINSGAVVEHDCVVLDHAHVATGARLAGNVEVGRGAHVGASAAVLQGLRIGAGAVVGLGAAVIRDVADAQTVVGVPARPVRGPGSPRRGREG